MSTLKQLLTRPVPMPVALSAIAGMTFVQLAISVAALHHTIDLAQNVIDEKDERIQALRDIAVFLADHASPEVVEECQKKADFWNIILNTPDRSQD